MKRLPQALAFVLGLTATLAHAEQPAQASPKAYIVAEIEVTDAATYEGYKGAAGAIVARYGGRYIVRGGQSAAVEGQKPNGRVVIVEFPNLSAATAFLNSDEYRPVAAIRQKSTRSRLFIVEGMPQ